MSNTQTISINDSVSLSKRKRLLIGRIAFYCLYPLILFAFTWVSARVVEAVARPVFVAAATANELSAVNSIVYYGTVMLMIPILMRFSLFKFYIDPIAAAEWPLFLIILMLGGSLFRDGLIQAALSFHRHMADDGGLGYLTLIGQFLWGLLASFSIRRKEGKSISFRLIEKSCKPSPDGEKEIGQVVS